VDTQEVERRFREALLQAGLLKEAAEISPEDADAIDLANVTTQEETTAGEDEKTKADKAPPAPPTFINLFQHPAAHPYVLDLALLRQYGPEWMEWERETLEAQVPLDFRTSGISDLNMQKLNAVKTLHYVDTFWQNWEVFVPCVMALNSLFPDFRVMQVPTTAQCAVAVDIANRIREDVAWSDEMKVYLEIVHRHDDIFCAVDPLGFVQIDTEGLPVDCQELSRLWPAVRKAGKAPSDESVISEQLRRLLIVHEMVKESQAHLASQLPLLLHG
jgi:hypothetical protein